MRLVRHVLVAGLAILLAQPLRAGVVNIELALLVDVSGSVDASEFDLQMQGYANAFRSTEIQNLIVGNAAYGGVAVNMVLWSSGSQQSQVIDWTLLTTPQDADDFATLIEGVSRPYNDLTAPGSAIQFATTSNIAGVSIFNNGFTGTTLIVDVSGDGVANSGINTSSARNAALLAGVDRINGLAIGGQSLVTWYKNNVQGGDGSFTIQANTFQDFEDAIKQKLRLELQSSPVPEPSSAAVFLGLTGLALLRLRRRRDSSR